MPVFKAHSEDESIQMIKDPKSLHPELAFDTEWLSERLCGSDTPPPSQVPPAEAAAEDEEEDAQEAVDETGLSS